VIKRGTILNEVIQIKILVFLAIIMVNKDMPKLNPKERRAYIAWEDNDDSTSSSSQDESEEANLCLIVGYESFSSSQVISM